MRPIIIRPGLGSGTRGIPTDPERTWAPRPEKPPVMKEIQNIFWEFWGKLGYVPGVCWNLRKEC